MSSRIRIRWQLMLRGILHWWVKARALPDPDGRFGVERGKAVCYVMDDYALSSVLILDRMCEEQGLARPLFPIEGVPQEHRAYAVLRRLRGWLIRRPSTRRSSDVLRRLVERCEADPSTDILLVPVTVFVGRAPDKSSGFAKVLFAENWQVAGRFRRFVSTLINGRDTLVQFSRPISLRELAEEGLGSARSLRKVSRILRTHFRRVRNAAIGPDLSHRRMLIDRLLQAPTVRKAIAEEARSKKIDIEKARKQARKYALEIAADYSYTFIRIAAMAIAWFTGKVLSGIRLFNFERFKAHSIDHEVIYVPCHRSHLDYMLISYLVHQNGLVAPHVAAGINLNLPLIGGFLRGGGAFYLRRTFKSQKLYAAVFNEYLSTILAQGTSIEYYVEGTRSRTGRLLQPRAGMLAMTVKGYLHAPVRPVMFQPVYIGYEQVMEAAAYTRELSGSAKRSERLSDLFKVLGVLGKDHGVATVSFGEPIFLDELLEHHDPDWREHAGPGGDKPPWMPELIDQLGTGIMTRINATADVNPVALLATALLGTPRLALGERDLLEQLALYVELLKEGGFGPGITVTEKPPSEIVDYGIARQHLVRIEHPLGDMIALAPEQAVELTYARNNIAHLLIAPSLVACCFLNQRSFDMKRLEFIAAAMHPFLKSEWFLPFERDEFITEIRHSVHLLTERGLLEPEGSEGELSRASGDSREAGQLFLLAQSLLQTLERYFITIALLSRHGSGVLSRAELETLCIQTAQRISRLYGFEAPEFYDRNLFKHFIGELRRHRVLTNDDDGLLKFDARLDDISHHARFILRNEIRLVIMRLVSETTEPREPGSIRDVA
ncbi:MAG: glycerol-3-phosphate 1-O-acyltransferase PlsB [Xanthomonadales bacterium]|nr:glycerol-3-phosphate 1-O-acyltransferase PlsB [Xanthomonadales bacterium]